MYSQHGGVQTAELGSTPQGVPLESIDISKEKRTLRPPIRPRLLDAGLSRWFFLFLTTVNMAFLTFRSPKGGHRIPETRLRSRRYILRLFRPSEDYKKVEPEIVDDLWALHIGYCNKCAQRMLIPESTGKELWKMLTRYFG